MGETFWTVTLCWGGLIPLSGNAGFIFQLQAAIRPLTQQHGSLWFWASLLHHVKRPMAQVCGYWSSPVERYCSSALGLWVTSADLCNCWLSHHPALLTQGLPGESGIFHRWNPMVLGLAVSQKTTWASRPPGTAYCQTSRSRNSFKEWPKLEQKCNSVEKVRCTNCLEKMHCWHLESCKARQNRLMKKLAF